MLCTGWTSVCKEVDFFYFLRASVLDQADYKPNHDTGKQKKKKKKKKKRNWKWKQY